MEDPNAGRSSRAQFARDEEEKGNIRFEVVWNDGEPQRLIYLVQLKSLFSKQLPNMPKHYIIRIVMDRNHRSLCLLKDNHVIAGICFRPFHSQKFCELVFVAVSAVQQVKGFGTRIMNTLKEHAKTEHFEYFLTYADNHAIGYFQKQGFSKHRSMPSEQYSGYIKHYDSSTLMECKIIQQVEYRELPTMLANQRRCVEAEIKKLSNSHKTGGNALNVQLTTTLQFLTKQSEAWPFKDPVDAKLAHDYYKVIKQPRDFKTIGTKIDDGKYSNLQGFIDDVQLVFNNCRTYNEKNTSYYSCADRLEKKFRDYMQAKGFMPGGN